MMNIAKNKIHLPVTLRDFCHSFFACFIYFFQDTVVNFDPFADNGRGSGTGYVLSSIFILSKNCLEVKDELII